MLKDELADPQGQAVAEALPSLGFEEVADVRIGKHIELELADREDLGERVTAMADKLLANPVIERFTYHVEP
jgi:phosphoribosylformylglycinamidine synthase